MDCIPRVDLQNEEQISEVYKFEDDMAHFKQPYQEQDDTESNQDQQSSQAVEIFKIIRQETYLIYQQCDNFKELLTYAFKKQITGHPMQKKNSQESQKILACKFKTISEILASKKNDLIKLFLEERRREEEQIQNQVVCYKQRASFASSEALQLFSRQYQLQDSVPNTIYLNLYSDQLASRTLTSKDIFHPVERKDAVLSFNIDPVIEGQEFQIIIRREGVQIAISGPPSRGQSLQIQMIREKYIENVILLQWLREQLHCDQEKIIVPLLEKYEIEFSTCQTGEPRNPIYFMKLIECVYKREGIQHYLDQLKQYIVIQDHVKQKFNQVDANKILNSKVQFESLQFFTRTQIN